MFRQGVVVLFMCVAHTDGFLSVPRKTFQKQDGFCLLVETSSDRTSFQAPEIEITKRRNLAIIR